MTDTTRERLDRISEAIEYVGRKVPLNDGEMIVLRTVLNGVESPPPKSESETLADIANSLPQEVLGDAAVAGSFSSTCDVSHPVGYRMTKGAGRGSVPHLERWLLGVMAKYVGGEPYARVWIDTKDQVLWEPCWGLGGIIARDFLTAYRDCCLAIHEGRKEAGR